MLISEAMVMLAPYGVERIEMSRHTANLPGTPVWRVTHHDGQQTSYCASLETLVWALTPSDDGGLPWEG
jgi:hypothetical protein